MRTKLGRWQRPAPARRHRSRRSRGWHRRRGAKRPPPRNLPRSRSPKALREDPKWASWGTHGSRTWLQRRRRKPRARRTWWAPTRRSPTLHQNSWSRWGPRRRRKSSGGDGPRSHGHQNPTSRKTRRPPQRRTMRTRLHHRGAQTSALDPSTAPGDRGDAPGGAAVGHRAHATALAPEGARPRSTTLLPSRQARRDKHRAVQWRYQTQRRRTRPERIWLEGWWKFTQNARSCGAITRSSDLHRGTSRRSRWTCCWRQRPSRRANAWAT